MPNGLDDGGDDDGDDGDGGGISCRFKLNYYFKVNFTLKRLVSHSESIKQTRLSLLPSLSPYAGAECLCTRARTRSHNNYTPLLHAT